MAWESWCSRSALRPDSSRGQLDSLACGWPQGPVRLSTGSLSRGGENSTRSISSPSSPTMLSTRKAALLRAVWSTEVDDDLD